MILCEKLAAMHADLYEYPARLTVEDLAEFIKVEFERVGADINITPREVIRDFIELLDLMYQNPALSLSQLLASEQFTYAKSEAVSDQTAAPYTEFTI